MLDRPTCSRLRASDVSCKPQDRDAAIPSRRVAHATLVMPHLWLQDLWNPEDSWICRTPVKARCPFVDCLVMVHASSASVSGSIYIYLTIYLTATGNACKRVIQPGTNNIRSGTPLDKRCHRNKDLAPVHEYADQLAAKLQCLHKARSAGGPGSFFPPACDGCRKGLDADALQTTLSCSLTSGYVSGGCAGA